MMNCALCLTVVLTVSGCAKPLSVLEPCDILRTTNPPPTLNTILVNDYRKTAIEIAAIREQYKFYKCGSK